MSTQSFNTVKKSLNLTGVNLTAFNEPISSGVFMEVGRHEVVIENVEAKDGMYGEQVVVTWKREDGASIKQYIPLEYTDPQTKAKNIAKGYIMFSLPFIQDRVLRNSFFLETVINDTSKFGMLTGLKAAIVVGKGKKGYDIVSDPVTGGYIVVDVATNEKLIESPFMSIGDANTEAKNQGLTRAYNTVVAIQSIASEVEKNEQAIRTALSASPTAATAKTLQANNML